jgi:hypothetical protein
MRSSSRCAAWSRLIRIGGATAAATLLVGPVVQAAAGTAPTGSPRVSVRHSPYLAAQHLGSADTSYALQWGVDTMQAHQTNSGNLIRFSYRVVDTGKAKVLIDKAAAPLMVAPKANVALQVPVMDKVGPLRQATELEAGKTYWMVFSNKGGFVKVGDRVSVLVGKFRVDGLVVQ